VRVLEPARDPEPGLVHSSDPDTHLELLVLEPGRDLEPARDPEPALDLVYSSPQTKDMPRFRSTDPRHLRSQEGNRNTRR